jgi:hypothetical protein
MTFTEEVVAAIKLGGGVGAFPDAEVERQSQAER